MHGNFYKLFIDTLFSIFFFIAFCLVANYMVNRDADITWLLLLIIAHSFFLFYKLYFLFQNKVVNISFDGDNKKIILKKFGSRRVYDFDDLISFEIIKLNWIQKLLLFSRQTIIPQIFAATGYKFHFTRNNSTVAYSVLFIYESDKSFLNAINQFKLGIRDKSTIANYGSKRIR